MARAGGREPAPGGGLGVERRRGVELERYGDPGVATYWRSAAKPFQALPWVRGGVVERFGWDDRAVAIMCASHVGSDEHAELGARACSPTST